LLAASRLWSVVESSASELRAALAFARDPGLLAAFPFPHRLELSASVDAARLSIGLTLTPTSEVPVPVCFGFHPYLRLPDSDRREWTISVPVRRRLALDERGIPTGATEELAPGALSGALGDRAFDDCFDRLEHHADGSPPVFAVADGRLRLAVEFVSGFSGAQLYAPAGSGFICFEPMTAPIDALRDGHGLRFATPGGKFFAQFAVTVTEN
jgi:galactose mutarotase-like enzyme